MVEFHFLLFNWQEELKLYWPGLAKVKTGASLHTVGGNGNWYKLSGRQRGGHIIMKNVHQLEINNSILGIHSVKRWLSKCDLIQQYQLHIGTC